MATRHFAQGGTEPAESNSHHFGVSGATAAVRAGLGPAPPAAGLVPGPAAPPAPPRSGIRGNCSGVRAKRWSERVGGWLYAVGCAWCWCCCAVRCWELPPLLEVSAAACAASWAGISGAGNAEPGGLGSPSAAGGAGAWPG